MAAVASQLSFEVLRFAAEPVSSEVGLLELEGRFRAGTRRRLGVPRLVAEDAYGSREIAPAVANEAIADPDGSLWCATYAVAIDDLGGSVFSLAVGRELLLGLPAPDIVSATGDREVRLAREANALRRTADEARDAARETALAGRDQEAARAAEEHVAEIEAELGEARRALRAARAETEGMRRELERERERADVAESAVRRGRVTEIGGEPVNGGEIEAARLAASDDETTRLADADDETTQLADADDETTQLAETDDETTQLADADDETTQLAASGDDDETTQLAASG